MISIFNGELAKVRMWEYAKAYYDVPGRYYHVWDHALNMLEVGEKIFNINDTQKVAIVFHDCVYDARRSDNEDVSAAIMRNYFEILQIIYRSRHFWNPDPLFVDDVEKIILDTKKHFYPSSQLSAEVLDLDIMGIAGDYDSVFIENGNKIRKEFSHLLDEEYNNGRKKFFEEMLALDYIYNTSYGRWNWEQKARDNITRFLAES